MKRILIFTVAGLLVFLFSAPVASAFGLKDVLKMNRDGIADSLIIQKIEYSGKRFRLDADDMHALQEAGVSDEVISAMFRTEGRDGDEGYYDYYGDYDYYPRTQVSLGFGFGYGHPYAGYYGGYYGPFAPYYGGHRLPRYRPYYPHSYYGHYRYRGQHSGYGGHSGYGRHSGYGGHSGYGRHSGYGHSGSGGSGTHHRGH